MVPDKFGNQTLEDADENVSMLLASGKEWRPFRPRPEDFEWSDIAIGASRIPRFGGQLSQRFAVDESSNYVLAQHLCLAHDLAKIAGENDSEILVAVLLHDAEEALGGLGDPVGPVKHSPRFRDVLKGYFAPILDAIAVKAGIDASLMHGDSRVKQWDKAAYKVENWHLRGLRDGQVPELPYLHRRMSQPDRMAIWATLHAHYVWRERLDKALFNLLSAREGNG